MGISEDILTGKICPYCNNPTEFVDGKEIYGLNTNFGMFYRCKSCKAHVGVNRGTTKALGRLANKELRKWKMKAHEELDQLWKGAKNETNARSKTYKWLSNEMNIDPEFTHIGMFDIEECKKVIELCEKRKLKK